MYQIHPRTLPKNTELLKMLLVFGFRSVFHDQDRDSLHLPQFGVGGLIGEEATYAVVENLISPPPFKYTISDQDCHCGQV